MWLYMCMCCGLFVPIHKSISNVVASLMVHDDIFMYILFFKLEICSKKHETIAEGQRFFQPNIMESV